MIGKPMPRIIHLLNLQQESLIKISSCKNSLKKKKICIQLILISLESRIELKNAKNHLSLSISAKFRDFVIKYWIKIQQTFLLINFLY
jgi:hypothetical protein